jgi:7-cyano-7-deazaguanine synthase
MPSAVVLLSAGLDSTVNLYQAKRSGRVVLALTFNYGQRAAKKEIAKAARTCAHLKIKHKVVDLPFFKEFQSSSLLNRGKTVPRGTSILIDDKKTSLKTAKAVWVANRNGIFLNIAAGFAESLGADLIIPGFNKEEAATFPDNSRAFLKAVSRSLNFSTANHVKAKCYTAQMDKTKIVSLGKKLGVRWEFTWPCYHAKSRWCGECESCQRAKRAFKKNQINIGFA